MNDKPIIYSSDLSNQNQIGLFDRIINIKFTRQSGEIFTLRSDYEPVWNGNQLFFKTCQPKPEIRVTYTQYQGTMVTIDIYVTNLNIKESASSSTKAVEVKSNLSEVTAQSKTGTKTNMSNDTLTKDGDPIKTAEIEMGYRGSFYNWAYYDRDGYSAEVAYDAFLNLKELGNKNKNLSDSQIFFGKHRKCTISIEWAHHTNNPPDRITQFHGYVSLSDSGLQPFGKITMDSPGEEGVVAKLTKENIFTELNDTHSDIDEVNISTFANDDVKSLLLSSKGVTRRNFFNGGRGFTLLEAICFHTLSRRFIRPNISAKRNKKLEQVCLEFLESAEFKGSADTSFKKFKVDIEQKVYNSEFLLNSDYFVKDTKGLLSFSDKIPSAKADAITRRINNLLVDRFVGAQYTVKGLPDYRNLYVNIRKTMSEYASKGIYASWWDAVSQVENMDLAKPKIKDGEPIFAEVENTLDGFRSYLIGLHSGELKDLDTRIEMSEMQPLDTRVKPLESLEGSVLNVETGLLRAIVTYSHRAFFSADWILPVQNLKASVQPLKDSTQKEVKVKVGKKKNNQAKKNNEVFQPIGPEQTIPCFAGLFEVRDAYMFGIAVFCTEEASKIVHKKYADSAFIELQFLPLAHLQIAWICKTYGLLYYKMHNGSYILYGENEDTRTLTAQAFIKNQSKAPIKINAVYDITISPIRKIRMPFLGFLDPMTILEWNSSSAIGEMVSFYYQPKLGRNFFTSISNTIDFSTTGDQNVMEVTLVDTQWTDPLDVPKRLTGQEKKDNEQNVFTQVIIIPDEDMDTWRKIYNSDMGKVPFALIEKWGEDVEPGVQLTISNLAFFSQMKLWNETLFQLSTEGTGGWVAPASKAAVDKTATWLYGENRPDLKVRFPEISYCFDPEKSLIANDLRRVYLKFPVMPSDSDYSDMKEIDTTKVLVYNKGEWSMQLKTEIQKDYFIGAK
jgi:hypothetical protein